MASMDLILESLAVESVLRVQQYYTMSYKCTLCGHYIHVYTQALYLVAVLLLLIVLSCTSLQ